MRSNPMPGITDQTLEQLMPDRTDPGRLEQLVMTPDQFDQVVSRALPALLDRATACTKRFLRETGQWSDDMAHEKFVLRWEPRSRKVGPWPADAMRSLAGPCFSWTPWSPKSIASRNRFSTILTS